MSIYKNVIRKKRKGFLIGEKLSELLRRKGISQYRLSQLTGIPQPVISDYIRNRHGISYENLEKIAEVLKVPITYFFEEEELTNKDTDTVLIEEIEELLSKLPPEKREKVLRGFKEQLEALIEV